MNKPRSLVTGGAGFIGSHVAEWLLKMGHDVMVLDDLSGGFEENVPSGARFIRCDITDILVINYLFAAEQFDYVFHLAAYAAEGLSHFIRRFNYTNNLIGSVNLINAAVRHEVKRFVFTSSIAVYGNLTPPLTEAMTPVPEDPYGIAKFAVEQDLRCAASMFGLKYTIFRPHNVYGPRQNIGDRYRNVIGIFMNQCLKGEPMTIFGDGSQSRAFTFIGELYPIVECLNQPSTVNEIFNIGSSEVTEVRQLADGIGRLMEVPIQVIHLPSRHESHCAYADSSKLSAIIGKRECFPLELGIASMASWVKQHGPRQSAPVAELELTKNLPPSWA